MLRRALALTVLLATALLAVGSSSGAAAPPGFVGRSGANLELDGQPYRFSGINVYNANNLSGCWYAMGSGSTLDESLSAMSSTGGPKVMRAWFFQALATSGGARDWSATDNTLAVAAAHGTRVIATLGNQWSDCDGPGGGAGSYKDHAWYTGGYTEPDAAGTVSYRDWVAEIVDRYKDDPTILAWQLLNEAEVKPSEGSSCSPDAAVTLKDFAADVSGLIKSIDANHLVSLGTIGGGQCGAQGAEYQDVHDLATIDLCEYHDYGSPTTPMPGDQWNGLQVRVDQCNALDKPLFVGETGIRQEDMPTLQSRANAFRAKFGAQFLAGVDGELVWAWNKDGSAGSYDIGPGDPVLALLDEFKDGPPESTMTSLTAPAPNTIRITGFGLDDLRWIAINGGTRTGYNPYISYSLSVDRDLPNYGHGYQPGDLTVNEWSENVISITMRSGWYQDEYTRYITLVYSSGPNIQPETPVYVPGPNETFPPEPTTTEGPVITALTAPSANTIVVHGRNLDMLPYDCCTYRGDIIFEGNGYSTGVSKPYAVPPPYTFYTINEYSNTRVSVTIPPQYLGSRYVNKIRYFQPPHNNGAEFVLPGAGVYVPADGEPIDTTPPTVSITTPANGAQYFQGDSVPLAFSCGDDYELRSCQGQIVETGQFVGPHYTPNVPTSQLGSFTLRVTATDKFLNTTVSSASYTVVSNPDADGDGVPDSIDSDGGAGTGPPGFTDNTGDGKTTTGALVSGSMTVTDAADPKGIRITAGPSGVVLTVCSGFGLELDPGESVTVTCGSVTVENVVGAIVVRVPGNNALVTFPQGTSGTISTTGGVSITNVTGTGVTVTVGGVQAPVTPGDSNLIQRGTAGDRITGTAGNDLILDAGGANTIDGKGGNDTIVVAGSGSNNIAGGAGDDSITSGSGNDTIDGGDGSDTINAGNGNNSVKGGAGNDRLRAGTGNDTVDGGAGTDLCNAGSGKNTVKNCEGTLS